MKHTTRAYRTVAVVMALLSNGCYTFGSTGLMSGVRPETRIAAQLTTRATLDYESRVGPEVERVEGIVARSSADSVALRILRTRTRSGDWAVWKGEQVTFGVNDFARSGERRFSRGRTALAVGGLALVLGLVISTDLFGIGGSSPSTDPRPIPPVNPG